jgi:hypothetical protein
MADTYFRARRRKPFTTISNACLRDTKLSVEAVGFLAVMVSMSPEWVLNKVWLRSRFSIGREKLDRIIRELKTAGYAVVVQDRDPATGRMGRVTYVFTDEAGQFDEEDPEQVGDCKSPVAEKPYSGGHRPTAKPVTGKPSRGKPTTKKEQNLRNTKNKKKQPVENPPQSEAPAAPAAPTITVTTAPPPDPAMRERVAGMMRDFASSMRMGFAGA